VFLVGIDDQLVVTSYNAVVGLQRATLSLAPCRTTVVVAVTAVSLFSFGALLRSDPAPSLL
jgi:hypothetical protein